MIVVCAVVLTLQYDRVQFVAALGALSHILALLYLRMLAELVPFAV
jgi:uncharacterized MnhB-related membrane protein